MFLYIASPYSHADADVRHQRYLSVLEVTAKLLKSGLSVYSPIAHCHDMALKYEMPTDFAFWRDYNFDMLTASDGLVVLQLSGWAASVGVRAEIDFARQLAIPVSFLYPNNDAAILRIVEHRKQQLSFGQAPRG